MLKKFLVIFLLSKAVFAASENSQAEIWNSDEGLKRLERSQFKNDFYQLVNFYQPQQNPLFCSIATGTMIRNALDYGNIASQKSGEIIKPKQDGGDVIKYNLYAQTDFFNAETDKIKKRQIVKYQQKNQNGKYDPGLQLEQFAAIMRVHGFNVTVFHAEKIDENFAAEFRTNLKKILAEKQKFIATNFDGKLLDKATRGHVSPVVAFDEKSDSLLVLDAALHKNQWYWISTEKFLAAMNTKDDESFRGYAVIEKALGK